MTGADRPIIFAPFMTAFGGVERLAVSMSAFLHQCGVGHSVVTFANPIHLETYADWPMDVVELSGPRSTFDEWRRLRQWVGQQKSSAATGSQILVFDLRGAFYAWGLPVPYCVHLTDPPSLLSKDTSKHAPSQRASSGRSMRSWMKRGELRAEVTHRINTAGVRKARKVIAMTDRIAREIEELYHVKPVVIRPGVDNTALDVGASRNTKNQLRFFSISRLVTTKRINWIFDALAALEREIWRGGVEWSLTVAGDGPEKSHLVEEARRAGIADKVIFPGRLSETELEEAYANTTLFLMPAAQGWGLPALEALTRRIPVILHEDSGVSEILRDTKWVTIARDPEGADFKNSISEMLTLRDTGFFERAPAPDVPSSNEWARQVSEVCEWQTTSNVNDR